MNCAAGPLKDSLKDPLTLRHYCKTCASGYKTSSRGAFLTLMDDLLPLGVGCHVECRAAGVTHEGSGIIVEVSEDLKDGGTPVHPAYLVNMDGTTDLQWYTSVCLTRIKDKD